MGSGLGEAWEPIGNRGPAKRGQILYFQPIFLNVVMHFPTFLARKNQLMIWGSKKMMALTKPLSRMRVKNPQLGAIHCREQLIDHFQ
jgi:hypothetical protein